MRMQRSRQTDEMCLLVLFERSKHQTAFNFKALKHFLFSHIAGRMGGAGNVHTQMGP